MMNFAHGQLVFAPEGTVVRVGTSRQSPASANLPPGTVLEVVALPNVDFGGAPDFVGVGYGDGSGYALAADFQPAPAGTVGPSEGRRAMLMAAPRAVAPVRGGSPVRGGVRAGAPSSVSPAMIAGGVAVLAAAGLVIWKLKKKA